MERQTYTIQEAAQLLGVSARHLYTLANAGQIPVLRLGNRFVIPRGRLEEMLRDPAALAPVAR